MESELDPPAPVPPAPAPAVWPCPRCGHEAPEASGRCPRCLARRPGARRPESDAAASSTTVALLWLFGLLLLTNVVYAWVSPDLTEERPLAEAAVREQATVLSVVELLDAVIVLAAFAALRGRIPPAPGVPGAARAAWVAAPAVLALLLALNLGYHAAILELAGIEPEADVLLASGHHSAWLLALVCVQPAVIEELFFRRLVFDSLLGATGPGTAAFASAAMFAAAHTGALISFPVLLVVGLALAWLRWRSGSLLLPILVHFLHNLAICLHDLASS